MSILEINEEPAIRIAATLVIKGPQYTIMDCEGDEVAFTNEHIQVEKKEGTMLIKEWYYNFKVRKGQL